MEIRKSAADVRARAAAAMLALLLATWLCPPASADDPPAPHTVGDLAGLQSAFDSVIREVSPSVVGIRAQRRYFLPAPDSRSADSGDASEQRVQVNGAGAVLSADGLILTNEHVVQSATDIEILFHDGSSSSARVVGADTRSDLAVLRTERSGLRPLRFADAARLARGQWCVALGNPYGLGGDGQLSVSVGVVSNLGRQLPGLGEVDDRFYNNMIQTTASINPGNSGGPLFNLKGEAIGIVTAMHTRAAADEGIGFAIPLTPAKLRVIEQLRRGQTIEYGYVGMTVRANDAAPHAGQPSAHSGVVVQQVEPDGPAAAADIRVGDRITRYDGQDVVAVSQLVDLVGETPVGRRAVVEFERDGRAQQATLTAEARQVSRVSWMRGGAVIWRGLRLADLTSDSRARMRIAAEAMGLVVIDVAEKSAAERAGLRIGDVVEKVQGAAVRDTGDFLSRIRGNEGGVDLKLRGRGVVRVDP